MFTNFNADAEGIGPDRIVEMLLEQVREPRAEDYRGASADA
jgi:hypothetical protein